MTLKDAREAYYTYTGNVSELARQLSFAGIGVIWVFRSKEAPSGFVWDPSLRWTATLFVAALALDLLQYVYASLAWGVFHRQKEITLRHSAYNRSTDLRTTGRACTLEFLQEGAPYTMTSSSPIPDQQETFKAPRFINWPTNVCFWLKAATTFAGYILLLIHLAEVL